MDTVKSCQNPHNSISKKFEKQHDNITIGFDVENSSKFILRKHFSIFFRVLGVMIVLCIAGCALGGVVAFEIIKWRSLSPMSDVGKKFQFSSKIDIELSKQKRILEATLTPSTYNIDLGLSHQKDNEEDGLFFNSDPEKNDDLKPTTSDFDVFASTSDTNYKQKDEAFNETAKAWETMQTKTTTAIQPDNSVCKRFNLSFPKFNGRVERIVRIALGEYVRKDMLYNERVVYEKNIGLSQPKIYLYFFVTGSVNGGAWGFGDIIGSNFAFIGNTHCAYLEYPANGECNDGWLHYSYGKWEKDSSISVNCVEY